MLVGGKDSFHSEYYADMVEGTKSRSYNNNESQEETDELIKGMYVFLFTSLSLSLSFFLRDFLSLFLSFLLILSATAISNAYVHISLDVSYILIPMGLCCTSSHCLVWHGRSNPYWSCQVEERGKKAS